MATAEVNHAHRDKPGTAGMSGIELSREAGRYVARIPGTAGEGEIIFTPEAPGVISADHTNVPASMAGKGVARALLDFMLRDAREAGFRIVYEPAAMVWHHRRADLRRHLTQVANYGFHRGHFARRYPRTSLRPLYLIPSLWVLFICFSPLALLFPQLRLYILAGLLAYVLALAAASIDIWRRQRQFTVAVGAIAFIVPTHLVYGIAFLMGAAKSEIDTHRKNDE